MRQKIMKRLQEHLDYLEALGYNKQQLLGIFLYGSQNYGFANENSDVDTKVILIPSFEDMCLNKEWISKNYQLDDEFIDLKDIRILRDNVMKQSINYMEIFFTDYFILNPKYENVFNKYVLSNKEEMARLDVNRTIKSVGGQCLSTLKKDVLNNSKDAYNVCRLSYFLDQYTKDKKYEDCIRPEEKTSELLKRIKFNPDSFSREERKAIIAHARETVENIMENHPTSEKDAEVQKKIDTATVEILKFSMLDEKVEHTKDSFFKQLTNTEIKAYQSIIQKIGYKGNISISKMVTENKISRPVYNNLLIKMKDCKVAKVVNMGVKGTYIEITNSELKMEIG